MTPADVIDAPDSAAEDRVRRTREPALEHAEARRCAACIQQPENVAHDRIVTIDGVVVTASTTSALPFTRARNELLPLRAAS